MQKRHRLIVAGSLVIAIALAALASPAAACGCGAYIPRGGGANVVMERSLIRWNGHVEDIIMELSVQGSSEEAAWILPVPSRATARLGDEGLFGALARLTEPRLAWRYWLFPILLLPLAIALLLRLRRRGRLWLGGLLVALLVAQLGGCGGSAGPVTLLQRQTLGSLEVSNLAASDADALGAWLAANGYNFDPFYRRKCIQIALFGVARWAAIALFIVGIHERRVPIVGITPFVAIGLLWWSIVWARHQLKGPLAAERAPSGAAELLS